MSAPVGGWGYDKDIAASLNNIDGTLSRLVDFLERKEAEAEDEAKAEIAEASEEMQAFFKKAFLVGLKSQVTIFHNDLTSIINEEDAFKKAVKLRQALADTEKAQQSLSKDIDELDAKQGQTDGKESSSGKR